MLARPSRCAIGSMIRAHERRKAPTQTNGFKLDPDAAVTLDKLREGIRPPQIAAIATDWKVVFVELTDRTLARDRHRHSDTHQEEADRRQAARSAGMKAIHRLSAFSVRRSHCHAVPERVLRLTLWGAGPRSENVYFKFVIDPIPLFEAQDSSGDDLEGVVTMAAPDAVGREVLPIDREDFASRQRLGCDNQRCVREIHGVIRVTLHQLKGTRQCGGIEPPHRQAALQHELPKPIRSDCAWAKHVKCFREHGHSRSNRLAYGSQCRDTPLVLTVLRIEQCDKGPGIYQNHRPSFLRTALRTPRRVAVDGAMVYPPGPRSSSL